MRLTRNGLPDLNDTGKTKWQAKSYTPPQVTPKQEEPFRTGPVHDLIYDASCAKDILTRFPNAKITDASDFIHEGRFEVDVEEITWDQWFLFMFESGIGRTSLTTQLEIRTHPDYLKRLLKL